MISCPLGSTGAAGRGPALGREFETRIAVAGKACGLSGQLAFSDVPYPAFNLVW